MTGICAEPPIEGVLESAVFGFPHPDFGEGVTAVAVPRSGAALTEASILAALADRLAKFKAPRRVFLVESPAAQCDGQGTEGGAAGGVQGRLSGLMAVGADRATL